MTPEAIAKALGAQRTGRGWVARCPAHEDRTPSLSIRETADGKVLVRCFAGCSQVKVIAALRSQGLWPSRRGHVLRVLGRPSRGKGMAGDEREAERRKELARQLWRSSVPAAGTVAEAYLHNRGLTLPVPANLRFHAGLEHPSGSGWPAFVAAVVVGEGDGEIVGVHRTFLARDGSTKAPIEPQKMMLGRCRGGAVRLAAADAEIAVTEGIETGLAVLAATGIPTWAALSATGVRSLVLPPLPMAATVTICADHDPVGIAAAHHAAERWHWEGRQVRIAMPPEPGMDFNDLARARETSW